MNKLTFKEPAPVHQENITDHPGIVIMMPFNPKMSSASIVEKQVKSQFKKATDMLMSSYKYGDALPVISNLNSLYRSLNFHTFKKSIVAFAGRFTQKLLYLDTSLSAKIFPDDSFRLADLFAFRAQVKQFIAVMVSSKWTKTYHGENGKLRLIKTDAVVHLNEHDPEWQLHNKKEAFFNLVARQFDLISTAYDMPAFLVGSKSDMGAVYEMVSNKKNIVQCVDRNTKYMDEKALAKSLTPYISDWKTTRETFLIQQVEDARMRNMLVTGSRNIPAALKTCACKLLLLEENYHELSPIDFVNRDIDGQPSYKLYDKLDQVIEDVLEKGGDIELVHPGLLKDDLNMAMICASPAPDDCQGDVSNRSGSDRFL